MANNLIALVDGETVKLEGEALDELLAAQASATAKLEIETETKAAAKAAAHAKLEALGLTVEDLQALGL